MSQTLFKRTVEGDVIIELNILALDQATTSGFAVFNYKDGKASMLDYGKMKVEGKKYVEKIAGIKKWMIEIVEEYDIDAVVVEDVYYMRNAATHKKLSGLLYVLVTWLYENNIQFLVVTASQWRSSSNIKGKGRTAKKKASKKYVLDRFDIKVTNDESDAILIGVHAIEQLNEYQWGEDASSADIVFDIENSSI